MTVVRNTLVDESDNPLPNIYTEVRLIAYRNRDQESTEPTFRGNTQVLSRVITHTNNSGIWSLDLIPNSDVIPANSIYLVIERINGMVDQSVAFIVPDDGATPVVHDLVDLLTSIPVDLPVGASLVAFDSQDSGMIADNVEDAILEAFLNGHGSGNSFGWYGSAVINDDGRVAVEFTTPFGIDANTGLPYFDPGNVTSGEEAVLLPDLSLIQPGR